MSVAHSSTPLPPAGATHGTVAELVAALERRAAEAEREGATGPVANVYRIVLVELRAMNGAVATPAVISNRPAEDRYLTPEQLEKMLVLPKGYAYDHKRQLGGVKVGKYLRLPESVVRRRLERRGLCFRLATRTRRSPGRLTPRTSASRSSWRRSMAGVFPASRREMVLWGTSARRARRYWLNPARSRK